MGLTSQSIAKGISIRYNLTMQMQNNWGMIGHEWAVDLLRGHLINKRIRHAYLITGPRGVGRRTLALRMTQGLNCPQPIAPGIPCGECHTCKRLERMQHPDLLVVQPEEAGSILKVEQLRALQSGLSLSPYEAPYKVALLLHFEAANPNAANALLKTLEEPPEKVILFLTAQDAESLLPTIVSRCELIRLRPLNLEKTHQELQKHWGIPDEEARLLAHITNGCPGAARKLHQQPERLQQRRERLDDLQQLLRANRVERFQYTENLAKDRAALFETVRIWQTLWRDVLLRASGSSAPLTNLDWAEPIQQLAETLGIETAQTILQHLEQTRSRLEHYTNPRLTAEVLMLNLPRLG